MKKFSTYFQFPILVIGALLLVTSCKDKDDEDKDTAPANQVEYNATKYTLAKGAIEDYGGADMYGSNDTHFNYEFYTTDGTITLNNDKSIANYTGNIAVYVDLYSPGTNGFKAGTFNYVNSDNDSNLSDTQLETKYKDKYIIADGSVAVDTDGDKNLFEENDFEVTGGTVKVSGTAPNFTIEYNLTLENNKTLKGTYAGAFTISE